MSSPVLLLFRWFLLIFVVGLFARRGGDAPSQTIEGDLSPPTSPRSEGIYVWQARWDTDRSATLIDRARVFDEVYFFDAEIDFAPDGALIRREASWDWSALASLDRPIHPTLRIHALPRRPEAFQEVREAILERARDLSTRCREEGIALASLHLDYDCPTSRLEEYTRLLRQLRAELSDLPLSLTALPTWLHRRTTFTELIRECDFYVLQVHGLEIPARLEDPATLCDPSRARRWIRLAGSFDHPFYVALPTYTYRLFYDATGAFLQLLAEGPPIHKPEGVREREIAADPEDLASLVRTLQQDERPQFQGILWYRLPLPTDRWNWSWETLQAVRDGRAPRTRIEAELVNRSPSLVEIHVFNRGETNVRRWPTVRLRSDEPPLAFDGLNGYRVFLNSSPDATLKFTPQEDEQRSLLAPGENRAIGWIRFESSSHVRLSLDNGGGAE